jgi:diguanylate cyclase (GGDEF)-like protein
VGGRIARVIASRRASDARVNPASRVPVALTVDGRPRVRATVVALGLVLLVYASWQVLRWGPAARGPVIGDLFFYPVSAVALFTAWRASQRCCRCPQLRRAWRLIALSAAASLFAGATQTVYEFLGHSPYPSTADGLYLLFYPLMLAGLLSFPTVQRNRDEQIRLMVDLAAVVLAGSAALIYFVLGPTALADNGSVLETAFTIAYPVGDLVLLVGLGSVLLRGSTTSARRSLRLIGLGLGLYVVGDVIYDYVTLHSSYQGGSLIDSFYMVAIALFAVAAAQQPAAQPEQVLLVRRGIGKLPYAAAGFGFLVLLYSDRHDSVFPGLVMMLVAVLLATLVLYRQFLSQRDFQNARAHLRHERLHDPLTGLPNRTLLLDRIEDALANADGRGPAPAVALVAIDSFELVNDSIGHAAGDAVLIQLAQRLRSIPENSGDVACLDGREFALVIAEGRSDLELLEFVERVRAAVSAPVAVGTAERHLTANIGIAVATGGESPAELLRDAATALRRAKASDRAGLAFFDGRLRDELLRQIDLTDALARAIRNGELDVFYQPIVSLGDDRILSVEALVRWPHPQWGSVQPSEFIPLAEANGLIVPLGRYVIAEAARAIARWRLESPLALPLGVFVNVSPRELAEPDFGTFVTGALAEHGLTVGDIAFELTERVFIDEHDDDVARTLDELARLGIQLVLDDFGTGYSALASLKRLPLAAVKIDGYFIRAIDAPDAHAPITTAVVGLGKALHMMVIAEGVETELQRDYLRRLGCEAAQGFGVARPQEAAAISALISRNAHIEREQLELAS